MNQRGAVNYRFMIKLAGAGIGASGFFFMAFGQMRLGTILVGFGTIIIALGE